MNRSILGPLAVMGAAALVMASACSDDRSIEAFCDQLDVTVAAAPLFPDRTDGEPVPSADALDALHQLADVAPDEIEDSVEVLAAEADALVADVEQRAATTTTGADATGGATTGPTHPERAEVEAAQAAVAEFALTECGVTLDG